jgi:hypothetical protein
MSCTAVIMRHSIPVLSIIADGIGSVLPRGAPTIAQRSASSITTARNACPISNLRQCAHPMSLPQTLNHLRGPCDLEQSP